MEAEGDRIYYIFTGGEERNENGRYIIPLNATHVSIHESVTAIPAILFYEHPNIVELICHAGVKRIKQYAFYQCPFLKRVIIPGVEIVEYAAFCQCEAVTDVECPKLEIIGEAAFMFCRSLSNINLPSTKIVERGAFGTCKALADAKFGKHLESVGAAAFADCYSLQQITIPLKNGFFNDNSIFGECRNLKHVDLVEDTVLRETIAALLSENWSKDMNAEVDTINHILPTQNIYGRKRRWALDGRDKALTIREWIARVLRKIIDYKAQHRFILNEAAATLQLSLPKAIVMNDVVSYLELPLCTFDGEAEEQQPAGGGVMRVHV